MSIKSDFQSIALVIIAALPVDGCVLYHGGVIHNLPGIAKQHELRVLETKDLILNMIKRQRLSIDLLTQKIRQHYKIPENSISFMLTKPLSEHISLSLKAKKI